MADETTHSHTHSRLKDRLFRRSSPSPHHPVRKYTAGQAESQPEQPPSQPPPDNAGFNPPLYLSCGPLLRFTGIENGVWHGSVMVVTEDAKSVYEPVPELRLSRVETDGSGQDGDGSAGLSLVKMSRTGRALGIRAEGEVERGVDYSIRDGGAGLFYEIDPNHHNNHHQQQHQTDPEPEKITATHLHTERGHTFWRFTLTIPQSPNTPTHHLYHINNTPTPQPFHIPSLHQTMHIMYHSCNGFSLSVNTPSYSGPDPLWRDVLRQHTGTSANNPNPFHVMLGGGDQIYNDACRLHTKHFGRWTESRNRVRKRHAPFTAEMQDELEEFYLRRYMWWFSQGLFAVAAACIPMVNVWDDHDIIDGFGSYPHGTMRAPVFMGVGEVACKYYFLFQHQQPPQMSGESHRNREDGEERSWVLGRSPGPYINQLSRSVFMRFGPRVAFLGVDCRMERTRYRVCYDETWNILLQRCRAEITESEGRIRHLIVLLGVVSPLDLPPPYTDNNAIQIQVLITQPMVYPRLTWLETLLSSRAMTPLKALGRIGLLGPLFNKFDGGIEILDDLDDHWTTKRHLSERAFVVQELQRLAVETGVRVSILSGDVHLGAVGEFCTTATTKHGKKENGGKGKGKGREHDHRYMPNIISSAIANRPPDGKVADILNRCDRVHYLDKDKKTEEKMVEMFRADVDGTRRRNTHLLPRRNWCGIEERTEVSVEDGDVADGSAGADGHADGADGDADGSAVQGKKKKKGKGKRGSNGIESNLNVQLHVEIEQGDPAGRTRAYGLVVPGLEHD